MKNVSESMIETALMAHLRNSGTPASTAGMRAALHTAPTVRLTEARRACLGIAIKCVEATYEKDVAGDIITELKMMLAELEACQ
jgi:hypothetical protein